MHMLSRQEVAQTQDTCLQLPEQLIGEAAKAMLIPIRVDIGKALDVEFTVEAGLIQLLASSHKDRMAALGTRYVRPSGTWGNALGVDGHAMRLLRYIRSCCSYRSLGFDGG